MATASFSPRAMMPGQWPADMREASAINDDALLQTPVSPIGEEIQRSQNIPAYQLATQESFSVPRFVGPVAQSPRVRPLTSSSAASRVADEPSFDWPLRSQPPTPFIDEEMSSVSYLIFEPVVEEEANVENIDWRRYDPPQELLRSQDRASQHLESLLAPSIKRIQTRHLEEEQRQAAASRIERPLARAGRAFVKPRRQVFMTGALGTSYLTPPLRLTVESEISLSSNDSGYGSVSPGTEPSRSPRSATRRSFGVSALFKRKDRTIVNLEELDENHLQIPRSRDVSPLPDSPRTSTLFAPSIEIPIPESLIGECVSCLDNFATTKLIKLTCHSYCSGCFQRLINNALESETHWPPKCCLNHIPSASILPHLSTSTNRKFKQREAEWGIPVGDRIYCAQANCNTWIAPKHINSVTHSAKCPKCGQIACTICRGPDHGDVDCPQDPALQATIGLAEIEGWKRCYSCRALVEHNTGCRHMTCRCRAQFCYICGRRWRTCACSEAQLVTMQQRAETRRADENVRNARAAAEAEEERAAIRAVEEFLHAEEVRLARELAAQRRREEAQRRREEEERQRIEEELRRKEEARIAAINSRFRLLATDLEALHDVQRVLIAERYEFESEVLRKERQDALDTLSIRHPTEVEHLANESSFKVSEAEHKFESDYSVRLADERRIEETYVEDLRAFWKGKSGSEYEVRDARDELRRNQDKEYQFWNDWRKTQLDAMRERERRKMEALCVKQDAEVKAVDGRAKIDKLEWERKKWAENRWVEEVGRERSSMLGEMEVQEYGREI